MINRVHAPTMAKTDIMIQAGGLLWSWCFRWWCSGLWVGVGLGAGVWSLGGHDGCFGLDVELLGLMTLASQRLPLLMLGVCLVSS